MNLLVETKQEFTTQLINMLTPLIYEGIQSIYNDALEVSTNETIFKNFQTFLKNIPKWNNDMIETETNRILTNSKSFSWLEDLIKATLKSNIIVLTYNPTLTNQQKIDSSFYSNIKTTDFIHKIYIECARELWNNPYLLYHNYPQIELKRNYRDTISLIKDCIKEAIRKLLPVKHILQIYLGNNMFIEQKPNDNFDKSISEVEGKNLELLVKKELDSPNKEFDLPNKELDSSRKDFYSPKNNDSEKQKTVRSEIINIINDANVLNSSTSENKNITNNVTNTNNNHSIPFIAKESDIKNRQTKINEILNKDLKDDETSTSETSINNNQKFHEIFSNSVKEGDLIGIKKDNVFQNKDKAKFFSNYLNI
jgi:hypothetical protein